MANTGGVTLGKGDVFFRMDQLFVSTAGNQAAREVLTGHHHLALQVRSPVRKY